MSASTNEVTCAEIRLDSTIRVAIILRMRSISISSSPPVKLGAALGWEMEGGA